MQFNGNRHVHVILEFVIKMTITLSAGSQTDDLLSCNIEKATEPHPHNDKR